MKTPRLRSILNLAPLRFQVPVFYGLLLGGILGWLWDTFRTVIEVYLPGVAPPVWGWFVLGIGIVVSVRSIRKTPTVPEGIQALLDSLEQAISMGELGPARRILIFEDAIRKILNALGNAASDAANKAYDTIEPEKANTERTHNPEQEEESLD